MRKAVVTGASGLLGGNLCALLAEQGFVVHALRRSVQSTAHLSHVPCIWHDTELQDRSALADIFSGADVVFHCAGSVAQSRWMRHEHIEGNIRLTQTVIDATRRGGVRRLVHCSTTVACAIADDDRIIDEDDVWNLDSLRITDGYARSKHAAENIGTTTMHFILVELKEAKR